MTSLRLTFLTVLTMTAFAANSVLNRAAVGAELIDPRGFALIRVAAGAITLCLIAAFQHIPLPIWQKARLPGVAGLSLYMIGFSLAYRALDAGLGALILFGTVQIAMFGWSALTGSKPSTRAVIGAGVAFAGLALALWPGPNASADLVGAALMVGAGLGWAAYSLAGRSAPDALGATAANFLLCVPVMSLLLLGPTMTLSAPGIALAILSGAITSGLGYALWYAVLPHLAPVNAAVVQLSVPLIAIAAGALLLAETPGATVLLAAALVLGGIALATRSSPR